MFITEPALLLSKKILFYVRYFQDANKNIFCKTYHDFIAKYYK